jgi:hypothetical protein
MRRISVRLFTVLALALAVGLATGMSPYASSAPDGLERVAADEGFLDDGRPAGVQDEAPLPDYAVPGIDDQRVATGLAGFLGTLAVFALGYGLAAGLRRLRPPAPGVEAT